MTLTDWLVSFCAFLSVGVILGVVVSILATNVILKLIAEPIDELPDDLPDEPWPGAANDPEPDLDPAA